MTRPGDGVLTIERACRTCGSRDLDVLLDLGSQPLANALVVAGEASPSYPLTLALCGNCGLVQIRETVAPEVLFDDYLYFSSFADALIASARALVDQLVRDRELDSTSLALEIASNDGYLLQFYKAHAVRVLGVEPAAAIAAYAEEHHGIPTLVDYFDERVARKIVGDHGPADVVHAHNVVAHVADIRSFVAGVKVVLGDTGLWVIEVPYVRMMLETGAFDLIYHEHLFYHSLGSLHYLLQRHDLEIFDVELIDAHGGSLRAFAGHPGIHARTGRLASLEDEERERGLAQGHQHVEFAARVADLRDRLTERLRELRSRGLRIVAYGAAAKATVLLNYFGLGQETLEYVVDRNPSKQGRVVPGVDLPIRPPRQIDEDRPDVVLITAWNYADEVMAQLAGHRGRGGGFVIPLPELREVGLA